MRSVYVLVYANMFMTYFEEKLIYPLIEAKTSLDLLHIAISIQFFNELNTNRILSLNLNLSILQIKNFIINRHT